MKTSTAADSTDSTVWLSRRAAGAAGCEATTMLCAPSCGPTADSRAGGSDSGPPLRDYRTFGYSHGRTAVAGTRRARARSRILAPDDREEPPSQGVVMAGNVADLAAPPRPALGAAPASIRPRGFFTHFPEQIKAYPKEAAAAGKEWFDATLGTPLALEQPGTAGTAGAER